MSYMASWAADRRQRCALVRRRYPRAFTIQRVNFYTLHKLLQQGPALFWGQTELVAYERSFLEGRFAVLIRWPARLIAYANGDLVAPFAHFHQCPLVVRGLVVGLFQLVDPLLETLTGVELIVC